MHETATNISAPALVYIGMGLITARILLDGTNTRGITWLQWLQFLVDAGSIVLLWPLVLFIEKFETWVKSSTDEVKHETSQPQPSPQNTRVDRHHHQCHGAGCAGRFCLAVVPGPGGRQLRRSGRYLAGVLLALLLPCSPRFHLANWRVVIPEAGFRSAYHFAERFFARRSIRATGLLARVAKFATGWAAHLYYWVYPGVMVAFMGMLADYLLRQMGYSPTVFGRLFWQPRLPHLSDF